MDRNIFMMQKIVIFFMLSTLLFDVFAGKKITSVQMNRNSGSKKNNNDKKKKLATKKVKNNPCCYDRDCCELSAMGVTCISCAGECFCHGFNNLTCGSNPSAIVSLATISFITGACTALIAGVCAHGFNNVLQEIQDEKTKKNN